MKKITIYSSENNNEYTKGSSENPFTEEEYYDLVMYGLWYGGYVEGKGFVTNTGKRGAGSWDDPIVGSDLNDSNSSTSQNGLNITFDRNGYIKSIRFNNTDHDVIICGQSVFTLSGILEFNQPRADLEGFAGSQYYGADIHVFFTIESGGSIGLFKFLTNNTSVEWGALFNGTGGDQLSDDIPCYYIYTNHQYDDGGLQYIQGYNSAIHSHPSGEKHSNDFSKKDVATFNSFKKLGYLYFYIYVKNGATFLYNERLHGEGV